MYFRISLSPPPASPVNKAQEQAQKQAQEQAQKQDKMDRRNQSKSKVLARAKLVKTVGKMEETAKITKGRRYTRKGKYIELDGHNMTKEDKEDFYEQDVAAEKIVNPKLIKQPYKVPKITPAEAHNVFKTPQENRDNIGNFFKNNEVVAKKKTDKFDRDITRTQYSMNQKIDMFYKMLNR
jgi:hypothetical protein